MSFYLAKILWIALVPSNLFLFLLAIGTAGLFSRWRDNSRWVVAGALLALILSGLGPTGLLLLRPLEDRFPRPSTIGDAAGVIVLGGGVDQEVSLHRGNLEITSAGDRMLEGALLAMRHPGARLAFSGGSGALTDVGASEADVARQIFSGLGLSADRLIFEERSRDTWENALFLRELIAQNPGEVWVLVTSAAHMPRAVGAFRKAGFAVTPYPVDYASTGAPRDFWRLRRAASEGLELTDRAAREYVGLLAYWLSGRTSDFFPAPSALAQT